MVSVGDKEQSGFGVAIVIISILVLTGLGIIGWKLYSSYSKPTAKTTTTSTTTQGSGSSTQQQTDPNAGYVVIKEWGVRFKPVSGLSGVVYALRDSDTAVFSTQQLTDADPGCSVQSANGYLGIGGVIRITTGTTAPFGGTFLAIIGSYDYYRYYSPESMCSNKPDVNNLQASTIQLFKESIPTLEAAK